MCVKQRKRVSFSFFSFFFFHCGVFLLSLSFLCFRSLSLSSPLSPPPLFSLLSPLFFSHSRA